MKTIQLIQFDSFNSKDVFREVLSSTVKGMNVEEMGKRWEIIKKINDSETSVDLENAEYSMLVDLFKTFPFARVDENILKIAETIKVF